MTTIERVFILPGLFAMGMLFASGASVAQDRCGTVEVLEKKRNRLAIRESDDDFEKWMSQRVALRSGRSERTGTYTIPVVFHVIHKGETIGTGTNIPDAQLISQIAVLNRDYNRTNSDASSTPAEFAPVAGSIAINFVLAKQDPDGNPSTGIVRAKGSKSQWSTNDESALKATSYWPAENYLNIWVTDLTSSLLGYAQFPVSGLDGLEDAEDNRLTDGVVVDYTVVGSNGDGTFSLTANFNKGRSATHEVGHFFGLRHIWGDDNGSCGGNNDYVSDTPDQGNSTSGCPSNPQTSCSVHTMFQNYMDYTNDACMNLFTMGQVSRMITVIENSPRRASLLVSPGAEDPAPVANDVALTSFEVPSAVICEASTRPVLGIVNNGTNAVSKLVVAFATSKDSVLTGLTLSPALQPGVTTTIKLDAADFEEGEQEITAYVISVNGMTDEKVRDNILAASAYLYGRENVPYVEKFESAPARWRMSGTSPGWATVTAPFESPGNQALYLNAFNAGSPVASLAITPLFSIPDETPYLSFDLAYARRSANDAEVIEVYALDACSDNVETGRLLYRRSGSDLATAGTTSSAFVPSGAVDWRQEVIDLSAVAGWSNVRFAIVGAGTNGNNVYIDNFQVLSNPGHDMELADVREFGPVSCRDTSGAALFVLNRGTPYLNSFQVRYTVNGEVRGIRSFSGLVIAPGKTASVRVTDIPASPDANTLVFEVMRPNGVFDIDTANNDFQITTLNNDNSDIIPYREHFENGAGLWSMVSPYGGREWEPGITNHGNSMVVRPDEHQITRSSWLAGPVFDLSNTAEAGVFFDVSRLPAILSEWQGSRSDSSDTLSVMVSADCGESYKTHAMIPLGYNAVDVTSPVIASQWTRRFVNLSGYAGQSSVRVAFALARPTAAVFLDNIEFFLSADSTPVSTDQPFTVYGTDPSSPRDFYITFALDERSDVSYSLVDLTGRSLMTAQLTNVLNQTYTIEPAVAAGIYLLRVHIGSQVYTTRVFVDQ